MKIQLFIMAFLLFMSSILGQSYSIVKGSVYGVSTNYDVIERDETKMKANAFEKGTQIHLTSEWGICTLRDKGKAHLFFSNQMRVWLGGKTTLWIDNFEQFVDKDEKGKVIPDDGGFVGNFRINGSADFKLTKLSEAGYFNVSTNGASADIKSKHFYIETFNNLTTIECYDGSISLTNSSTMKDMTINVGESASIYGKDGEMNLSIKIEPLTDSQKEKAKARLTELEVPDWVLLSPSPKKP